MKSNTIKELESARARVAALQAALDEERQFQLASLPQEHGFDDVDSFVAAVRQAAKSGRRAESSSQKGVAVEQREKSRRARLTPELKEHVKEAVKSGKTGAEIAHAFGISIPSVQNIKKQFGLVKTRSQARARLHR